MTILEILEAHAYVPSHLGHAYPVCLCLEWRASSPLAKRDEHRAHLAEVLETHQREAKAEALEDASRELTHPMYGIIVCDEYCANRSCPDCIRIRAAKDAADWLNQRAGKVREGL